MPTNTTNDITLFLTNSNIETESIITLIEEIIPLFVYIFSCLKYRDISGTVDLDLKLKFHNSSLKYKEFIDERAFFRQSYRKTNVHEKLDKK